MWYTLIAGVAGLGLSAGAAAAQDAPPARSMGTVPAGNAGPVDSITDWRDREFAWPSEPVKERLWGSAELLLGNTTSANVRPLITTGPIVPYLTRDGLGIAGTPGQPGTTTLFGGQKMLDDWRAGLRAEVGVWLDPERQWSASARFYSLFSTSEQFAAIGDGSNIIHMSRPSFPRSGSVGDLFTPDILDYVSFPGYITGAVSTTVQTTFTGGDLNLRRVFFSSEQFQFQGFAGYRQMHLGDEVEVAFRVKAPPFDFPIFLLIASQDGEDSVRTRNNFYGPHIGTIGTLSAGRWSIEGLTSVALGVNVSDLDYNLAPQGLNQYRHPEITTSGQVSYFSVIAEGGVRVGFRVAENASLTVGYTGIYWSNVRRAQEQYSLEAKPTGGTTHIFANLLSLGAVVRY